LVQFQLKYMAEENCEGYICINGNLIKKPSKKDDLFQITYYTQTSTGGNGGKRMSGLSKIIVGKIKEALPEANVKVIIDDKDIHRVPVGGFLCFCLHEFSISGKNHMKCKIPGIGKFDKKKHSNDLIKFVNSVADHKYNLISSNPMKYIILEEIVKGKCEMC
jgi:hypothetical protein